jgi:hypothetical protein
VTWKTVESGCEARPCALSGLALDERDCQF